MIAPHRLKFVFTAHSLILCCIAAASFVYAVHGQLMPYHLHILGQPWATLTVAQQTLYLSFMRGGAMIGLAFVISGVALLWAFYQHRTCLFIHILWLAEGIILLPTTYLVARLQQHFHAATPLLSVISIDGVWLLIGLLQVVAAPRRDG